MSQTKKKSSTMERHSTFFLWTSIITFKSWPQPAPRLTFPYCTTPPLAHPHKRQQATVNHVTNHTHHKQVSQTSVESHYESLTNTSQVPPVHNPAIAPQYFRMVNAACYKLAVEKNSIMKLENPVGYEMPTSDFFLNSWCKYYHLQ